MAYGGTSADGEPQIGLRSNASETKAGPVLDKVGIALRGAGAPFELHHIMFSSTATPWRWTRPTPGSWPQPQALGASPAFRAAAPDAASANLVIYLNVARLLAGGGGSPFGPGRVRQRQPGRAVGRRPDRPSGLGRDGDIPPERRHPLRPPTLGG